VRTSFVGSTHFALAWVLERRNDRPAAATEAARGREIFTEQNATRQLAALDAWAERHL